MSKYLPKIVFQETFDGDKFTATMEPLDRQTAMEIQRLLMPHKGGRGDTPESEDAIMAATMVGLEKSLESITGLLDAAGGEISVQTVMSKAYFGSLRRVLFGELWTQATLGKSLRIVLEEKLAASSDPQTSTTSPSAG